MVPIFRRFVLLTAAVAAPVAAQSFEDLDTLESRIAAALGAGIGEPGGPARPLDRRLRLAPCPEPATIDAPALGAIAVRCQPLGWRIRVPLTAGGAATAAEAQAEPIIRRGDQVSLIAMASHFTVSTLGIAEEDGAPGDHIRVRTERRGPALTGEVLSDGRVALPGFN